MNTEDTLNTLVQDVSVAFSDKMKEVLTDENMREIIKRNDEESIPEICHSHDFCDPNMLMTDAIRETVKDWGWMPGSDLMNLHNRAWKLAKLKKFYTEEH